MKSRKIASLNQRLISMWVEKACRNNQSKNKFLETYTQFCLDYIIEEYLMNPHSFFYLIKKEFMWDDIVKLIKGNEEYVPLLFETDNIPFYLIVCNKHENLFEIINTYLISNKILEGKNYNREKRKELKKSLKFYKNTSLEERKTFFNLLFRNIH